MGLDSVPGTPLITEDAEFAEGVLLFDRSAPLDAGLASSAGGLPAFLFASFSETFFLPAFFLVSLEFAFLVSAALSSVNALRFLSARAIASASHAAFTLPPGAGRLVVHFAEPASPAICAMVRSLKTEVSNLSILNFETT